MEGTPPPPLKKPLRYKGFIYVFKKIIFLPDKFYPFFKLPTWWFLSVVSKSDGQHLLPALNNAVGWGSGFLPQSKDVCVRLSAVQGLPRPRQ